MAKSGKSPSYHQKFRDEKRGEEIRKDNRGIVQIIGALSALSGLADSFLQDKG